MLKDTHLFCTEADKFRKYESYIHAPEESLAYREYWDEQTRRCLEGITINGLWIPGPYYFYLNFTQILRVVEGRKEKILDFPRFIDVDLEFFLIYDRAVKKNKGIILTKPRRTGFSYKMRTLIMHKYIFFRNSKSYIGAFSSSYSLSTMSMVLQGLGFLDEYTAWKRQRNPDTKNHIISRYKKTLSDGTELWKGRKSEVEALTFKDNPFASAGRSSSLFIFEECMAAGTKVRMYDLSLKNIEDIQVGDYTLGIDGLPKRVGKVVSGVDQMYTIHQNKGISYTVNSKHKLFLEQKCNIKGYKDDGYKLYSAEEFSNLGKYKKRTTYGVKSNPINFEYKDVPIEPYFIGAWLGDGDKYKTSIVVNIEKDIEIKKYIYDYAERLNYTVLVGKCSATNKCLTYTIQEEYYKPNPLLYKIKDLGIYKNKRIPKEYLKNSLEVRLEVLAGLIDTDGSLSKSGSNSWCYEISCTKNDLAKDIKLLAELCGFSVYITKKKGGTAYIKGKPIYSKETNRINIKGDIYRIPVKVGRKKPPSFWKRTSSALNTPIQIEDAGIQKYYGFTLEGGSLEDHLFLLEDFTITHNCGLFDNIIDSFNISEPCWMDGANMIGTPIVFGSCGDMEGGTFQFHQMFKDPKSFNMLEFDNIWEDGKEGTKCGWFFPASRGRLGNYRNLLGKHPEWEGIPLVDKDGNSNQELAELDVLEERELKKSSERAYRDAQTQYPLNLKEAFLRNTGSYYPIQDLTYRQSDIESDPLLLKSFYVGDLVFQDDSKFPVLHPSNKYPIREFPLKNIDIIEGAIEIYEKPKVGTNGRPPQGRYIAGGDVVDDDDNNKITNSLQSCFIFDLFLDRIVAEYTGRTKSVNTYYENVRRLCLYYNAVLNYENNKKGLFSYFDRMKSLHLLADTPQYLTDTELIKGAGGSGNRKKGTPSNSSYMKKHYEDLGNAYLLSQAVDRDEGVNNIQTIRSIGLLQELIYYDRIINTDRQVAFSMVLVLREELLKTVDKRKEPPKDIFNDKFFSRFERGQQRFNDNYKLFNYITGNNSGEKRENLFEI